MSGDLEGQEANHAQFEEGEGRPLLQQVIHEWGDNKRIRTLTNDVVESLDEKKEEVRSILDAPSM